MLRNSGQNTQVIAPSRFSVKRFAVLLGKLTIKEITDSFNFRCVGVVKAAVWITFLSSQSKHIMTEKQETLLDTINKLKSDIDKGKEKSAQQKAQIRDLQQVCWEMLHLFMSRW